MLDIIRLNHLDERAEAINCVRDARTHLVNYMKPESEYSAATQDFLAPCRQDWEAATQ